MSHAAVGALLLGLSFGLSAHQPRVLEVEGTYVHRETRREFPERVGEFQRESVREYGPDNIGIAYNRFSRTRPLAATVYLYRAADVPFDAELAAIRERHDGFELAFERDVELTEGRRKADCRAAGMSYDSVFAGRDMNVTSYLVICDDAPWRVKWRFTHPSITGADFDAAIDELVAPLTLRE